MPSPFLQVPGSVGARGALEQMVEERLKAEAVKQQLAQQDVENQQKNRIIGQGDQRLVQDQQDLALRAQPKTPAPMSLSAGASLVDPTSGRILTTAPSQPAAPQRPVSLSPGARLVDPTSGRLITSAPDRPNQNAGGAAGASVSAPLGVTGDSALEGQDEKTKNIVKLLADYKMQLPSGMALRTPEWQNYLSLARAYDPSFDAAQYGTRVKLRGDFTSGQGARNIRSLNTAIAHLDTLQTKADALNNFDVPLIGSTLNSIKNTAGAHGGDPRIIGFNNAATAVENELANAFKGTGATDQEVKSWRAGLNASESPRQFKEGISTAIELLKGRVNALQDQYSKGMGKPADFQMISPESQGILDRLTGGAPAKAGGGVTIKAIRQVQ